jgi:hypothetical protein
MQPTSRSWLVRLMVAGIVFSPMAVWALWKPVRVMAPSLAGMTCHDGGVCIDDLSRLEEARRMRDEAVAHVEKVGGSLKSSPTAVFCSTTKCDEKFGIKGNLAYNFGSIGLVVSSRGWKSYIVRHELIHCLQVERIGGFRMLLNTPVWLVEGMAYSASEDPRRPLNEPWERYRKQYETWADGALPIALWQRAARQ